MKKEKSNQTSEVLQPQHAQELLHENTIVALDRYAIIMTGGKQYFAVEGKTLAIEKLPGMAGDDVSFDQVLLRRSSPEKCETGHPYLDTPVKATIVKHIRGPKVIVFKMKRRKKQRTKKGHRQSHTVVRFTSID